MKTTGLLLVISLCGALFGSCGGNKQKTTEETMTDRIENFSINEVTVNEQNSQAIGFYEHMGFRTYKRTDTDEQGMPYPLLYMRL